MTIYCVMHGILSFPLIAAATGPNAEQILANIKYQLERNQALADDYPEICDPILALDGTSQRKASRYKRAKTGIMTLGSHADYHYRTEAAYFGAMEMAREMTRNNPLVMQGVRRLVANVVGRGFVLDSDSGDKGIDDVNGYRWESVIGDR